MFVIYFSLKEKRKRLEKLQTAANKGTDHIVTHNHKSFLDSWNNSSLF